MKGWHTVFLALSLALAAGCAARPDCARLSGAGRYCLQASGEVPSFGVLQRATLSFGGRRETLLTRIEADEQSLRFVALTPMGQTLFRVLWDNQTVTADLPPAMAERLEPALLPALVQIANWPAASLRAGLEPGLELLEQDGRREIRAGGETLLSSQCEGGIPCLRLHLSAPAAGFALDAETLPETLPP